MVKEGKRVKRSTDVEAADPERELQNSETDVNPKKLKKSKQIDLEPKKKHKKRCSTSTSTPTDVEAADHNKGTKPLQKAERELQNPETDVNPKKLKKIKQTDLEPKKKHKKTSEKIKEMNKLRKSFKEMTETMKNLEDFFMLKSDLPGMSLKALLLSKGPDDTEEEVEEVPEETEELATYECCFETEDSIGNNDDSVFVCNLDTSLARDEIKTALRKHFESCGVEVTRVFVPIQCETGVPLGFAFVDVDDNKKAIKGHSRFMGDNLLFIMLADRRPECTVFPNFKGCIRCVKILHERRLERFLRNGGR